MAKKFQYISDIFLLKQAPQTAVILAFKNYLLASSIATATATVIEVCGFLPLADTAVHKVILLSFRFL